jgi:hypothetical protein
MYTPQAREGKVRPFRILYQSTTPTNVFTQRTPHFLLLPSFSQNSRRPEQVDNATIRAPFEELPGIWLVEHREVCTCLR